MELEQALNIVSDICGRFQGNLQDHQNIQGALEVIKKALKEDKDAENKK